MGTIALEIPVLHGAKEGVVVHLVVAGQHAKVIRRVEVAAAVLQGDAALCDVVDLRVQHPGRLPGVAPPAVGVLSVMGRIDLAGIVQRLADLPGGDGIAIELDSARGQRRLGQQLRVLRDRQTVEHEGMTAVLPLEDQHIILPCPQHAGQVKGRVPALGQQHRVLLTVHDDAQPVLPAVVDVGQEHAQHPAGHPKADAGADVVEHRRLRVLVVDAAHVLEVLVGGADQPLPGMQIKGCHMRSLLPYACAVAVSRDAARAARPRSGRGRCRRPSAACPRRCTAR